MKLFQTMQSCSKIMGFDRNFRPLNRIVWIFFGIFGIQIIFYVIYLYTTANSIKEYNDIIYLTSSTILIANLFTTLSVKMEMAFEIIDQFEEFIEKSEHNEPI